MKLIHDLLKCALLTSAIISLNACNGTPSSLMMQEHGDAPMSFTVLSATSGEPLASIHIMSQIEWWGENEFKEIGMTGPDGKCTVIVKYRRNHNSYDDGPWIRFFSGKYQTKDTLLYDLRKRDITVKLIEKQ